MKGILTIISIAASFATADSAVQARDTRYELLDYALAACLTTQATGSLQKEGYTLASIVLSELNRSPLELGELRQAIKREITRTPMTTIHQDALVDRSDAPAPLAYCLKISRSEAVHAALEWVERPRAHRR